MTRQVLQLLPGGLHSTGHSCLDVLQGALSAESKRAVHEQAQTQWGSHAGLHR